MNIYRCKQDIAVTENQHKNINRQNKRHQAVHDPNSTDNLTNQ